MSFLFLERYATIIHNKSTCISGRFNRIEARASRVTEDKAGPPFSAKGETAEGALPGPGQRVLGRRRRCGVLSQYVERYLVLPVPACIWLFICMIYTTNAFSVRDCRLWCF